MCNLKIIQNNLLPRKLQKLKHLNMEYNKIVFIENEAFKSLVKMIFLDLSNNGIKILFKSTFAVTKIGTWNCQFENNQSIQIFKLPRSW
jgi:hypothetical protein